MNANETLKEALHTSNVTLQGHKNVHTKERFKALPRNDVYTVRANTKDK